MSKRSECPLARARRVESVHGPPALVLSQFRYTRRMERDHYHECLDCRDVSLCVSDCVPLRLTLCARCAERRRQNPQATARVIGLPLGTWCKTVARPLMVETEETLRRLLRRRGSR
jgi:hypothetical protein